MTSSQVSYPWFQESSKNEADRNTLLEQNYLASVARADRQKISYGNQDKQEKMSFAMRDAIERNGQTLTSAVERTANETRHITLKTELDTRANNSHDFGHVLLAAKDANKGEAKDIGDVKTMILEQAFRQEGATIQEGGEDVRYTIGLLQRQHADESGKIISQTNEQLSDLKNHSTEEYSELMAEQERHFAELGQLHADILIEQERGIAALGLQAEQNHGDTDRRMANYRSDIDSRLDKFGADLAMQLADVRNDLATQAARNAAKLVQGYSETRGLVVNTTGTTQGLVRTLDNGRLSDSLAFTQKEALFARIQKERY